MAGPTPEEWENGIVHLPEFSEFLLGAMPSNGSVQDFSQFMHLVCEHGIATGVLNPVELRRGMLAGLAGSPSAEDQHNIAVLQKYLHESYEAIKKRSEGQITQEDTRKLIDKATRKIGNCAQCNRAGDHRCGKCKQVHYCSKECQKAHWATHKQTCTRVSN